MDSNKRDVLKSLAVGSVWIAPVCSSVVLPVHAETSRRFSQTLKVYPCPIRPLIGPIDPVIMEFQIDSSPVGDGILKVTARGDLGHIGEFISVSIDGTVIGQLGPNMFSLAGAGSHEEDNAPVSATLPIPFNVLLDASKNGKVIIVFTPSDKFDCFASAPESNLVFKIEANLTYSI